MDALGALLSTQVLAGVLIVAALVMIIRSLLFYTREASEMGPKLSKIEKEISKIRDGLKDREELVETLTQDVSPLSEKEEVLRTYFDELKDVELREEKRALEEGEQEESDRRKRIQRKKMGFDASSSS